MYGDLYLRLCRSSFLEIHSSSFSWPSSRMFMLQRLIILHLPFITWKCNKYIYSELLYYWYFLYYYTTIHVGFHPVEGVGELSFPHKHWMENKYIVHQENAKKRMSAIILTWYRRLVATQKSFFFGGGGGGGGGGVLSLLETLKP